MIQVFKNSILYTLILGAAGSLLAGFIDVHWFRREDSQDIVKRRYKLVAGTLVGLAVIAFLVDQATSNLSKSKTTVVPLNQGSVPRPQQLTESSPVNPPLQPPQPDKQSIDTSSTSSLSDSRPEGSSAVNVATEAILSRPGQPLVIPLSELGAQDAWTTNIYSNDGSGRRGDGQGTGKDDGQLNVGGWGDYDVSLIKFNIPKTSFIPSRVFIRLHCIPQEGRPISMYLDIITSDWEWFSGGHFSWNNLPLHRRVATLPAPIQGAEYDIDITNIYKSWRAHDIPNFGLMLWPTMIDHTSSSFASTSNTNGAPRPRLVLVQ